MKEYLKSQNLSNSQEGVSEGQGGHSPTKTKKPKKTGKKPKQKNNKNDSSDDELTKGAEDAIVAEKPNVKWSDVAGLEGAKKSL